MLTFIGPYVVQDWLGEGLKKQEDLMMSANKEICFRGGASYYILIKDYKAKCFVFGITWTTRTVY